MFPISKEVSQAAHFALRLSFLTSDSQSLCWPVNHSSLNMHDPPGIVYILIYIYSNVFHNFSAMHQISKWRLFVARVKQNEAGGLDLIIRATDKSEQPRRHKNRQVRETGQNSAKIPRKTSYN